MRRIVRLPRPLIGVAVLLAGVVASSLAPIAAQAAGDTTPPTTTFSAPTNNQALPAGTVTVAGTSTDTASGIRSAQVAIRDRTSLMWWNPITSSWGTTLKWITTTLASPNQPSSTWSYSWSGGAAGGSYKVQARATDTSSNVAKSPFPFVNFTETSGASTPTFLRTLGGPGHAGMYPSGVEIDPADGSYVVADTGNDHVKKYSAAGVLLWDVGGFGTTTSPLRFNDPRDVGIDSSGSVYVADTGNVRIVKLNGATGAFVLSWQGTGADKIVSPIGITVSQSDDLVYVADAGKKMVRVYDHNGNLVREFGQSGVCVFSALRDVDAGPGGIVYIANYLLKDVLEMSST
ncbi:MAG: NHL repeat-containing protein, partial [Actinomycetota bacterium]